jgi:hypothetical protein
MRPTFGVNYCVAVVDEASRKIRLDLGNSISTNPSGGDAADLGALTLVCTASGATPLVLGEVKYRTPGWYSQTAGIVDLPEDRTLTDAEMAAVLANPLAVVLNPAAGGPLVAASEHSAGVHVRADMFVARLNPGETFDTAFRASKFGKPYAAAQIDLTLGPAFPFDPSSEPPTGIPPAALAVPASIACDAGGRGTAPISAVSPASPRGYVDGQVYRIDYQIHGIDPLNRSDFLSLLVWDDFVPAEPLTWYGSTKSLFEQYSNLYPVMNGFFDMSSYEQVVANRLDIITRLSLPPTDARYMPVTRDLSDAKRKAMLRWLSEVGADGKPLLGTPPVPIPVPNLTTADGVPIGGKARTAERQSSDMTHRRTRNS